MASMPTKRALRQIWRPFCDIRCFAWALCNVRKGWLNRSPDVGVAQLRIPFRRRFAEDLLRPSRAELALHARVQAVVRPGQRLAQLGLCLAARPTQEHA